VAAAWIRILSRGSVRPAVIDSHDLALYEDLLPDDQVVVVSHRGTKRYPREVIRAALSVGATVIAVTGQGSPLGGDGVVSLETCAQEAAGTHTISYTSALAVLARIAIEMLDSQASEFAASLAALPESMAETLAYSANGPLVDALDERSPAPLLVVGTGLDAITAEEAALKVKEGTYRWSEGLHTEFALHGTPAVYDRNLSAILIRREGDGGRSDDLRGVLETIGAAVFDCASDPGADLRFAATPDLLRPFVAILPLQRMVSELARRNGASPDQIHLEAEPWRSAISAVTL
jgi:glucosamine--fructose-6-phosphate aminotransferase (isomerizing)